MPLGLGSQDFNCLRKWKGPQLCQCTAAVFPGAVCLWAIVLFYFLIHALTVEMMLKQRPQARWVHLTSWWAGDPHSWGYYVERAQTAVLSSILVLTSTEESLLVEALLNKQVLDSKDVSVFGLDNTRMSWAGFSSGLPITGGGRGVWGEHCCSECFQCPVEKVGVHSKHLHLPPYHLTTAPEGM